MQLWGTNSPLSAFGCHQTIQVILKLLAHNPPPHLGHAFNCCAVVQLKEFLACVHMFLDVLQFERIRTSIPLSAQHVHSVWGKLLNWDTKLISCNHVYATAEQATCQFLRVKQVLETCAGTEFGQTLWYAAGRQNEDKQLTSLVAHFLQTAGLCART